MIAIPDMDKPKECIECEFSCLWVNGSTHCMVDGEELFCDGIPQRHDCQLIDIVRCKDCKYWHDHEWSSTCDKHIGNGFPSDYFCADGERRSE